MAKRAARAGAKAPKSRGSSGRGTNGRGSPQAVQKRRTARHLNTVLLGGTTEEKVDLRTERRRKRLLEELEKGRGGKALKPITVLQHADELLKMNCSASEVRKAAGTKYKARSISDELLDVAARTQAAYGFDPRVWPLLGIDPRRVAHGAEG